MVALRRTDDGGHAMGGTRHWRGAADYAFMDGEEGKRTKGERRRARGSGEQGTWTNIGGGEKEGTIIISDGKHRILKIGSEYRGNHSLCSGFGTTPYHNE